MSDPTAGASDAPLALSAWDQIRPVIAPVVGWGVSLACNVFARSALGLRWNVAEVPQSVQLALTVALLAVPAKLIELVVAIRTNPGNAASPRVAKAMKASSVGSASEGVENLRALAATGERPTAGAAASGARGPVLPLGAYHTPADGGTHDDDGARL